MSGYRQELAPLLPKEPSVATAAALSRFELVLFQLLFFQMFVRHIGNGSCHLQRLTISTFCAL